MAYTSRWVIVAVLTFQLALAPRLYAALISITLNTDDFGSETSYNLVFDPGGANSSVASAAEFTLPSNSTVTVWNADLAPGNYEFRVGDGFGDGIGTFWGGISPNYTIVGAVGGPFTGDFDNNPAGAETFDNGSLLVVPFTVAGIVVPEPSSLSIFGIGFALLCGSLMRRRKHA